MGKNIPKIKMEKTQQEIIKSFRYISNITKSKYVREDQLKFRLQNCSIINIKGSSVKNLCNEGLGGGANTKSEAQ